MKTRCWWLIFALLSGLASVRGQSAHAQLAAAPAYLSTTWTTEQGLPQNTITAITQTRDGYLWLGTFGGLARFDGVRFTIFNPRSTPGLKSNRIGRLYEDRDGALWISTHGGGLTRFAEGVFTTYTTEQGLADNTVFAVWQDEAGAHWVGTGEGLTQIVNGRFKTYTMRDGLPHNTVTSIVADSAGRLWAGTQAGLARFEAGRWTAIATRDVLPGNLITDLYPSQDGSIWVSADHRVAKIVNGALAPQSVITAPASLRSLYEDRAGTLWLGAFGNAGLLQVRAGRLVAYTRRDGLPSAALWSVYEDREGNLWLGTNGGGLARWSRRRITTYTTADGLAGNSIVSVLEDGAGAIWIGASCEGVSRWQDGRVTNFSETAGLRGECVRALLVDRAGELWVGAGNNILRWQNGRFTLFDRAPGPAPGPVQALYQTADGAFWIGAASGLSRWHDGAWTTYRSTDGLVNNDVRFLMEDRQGALWIGTLGGLSRFQEGRFTNYTTAQGLSHNFVRAIHEDADGALWIGTYGGGLNRLRAGKFVVITTKEGLFDDAVSRILEDEQGNFWMSGNRGIYRARRQELNDFADSKLKAITCVAYGVADGMKTSETNGGAQPAGWKARDGRLWFPTINGLVVLDPRRNNELPPPVAIEEVLINKSPVATQDEIEVLPGRRDIEIYYTGLSLTAAEKVLFKYKLENYDEDWRHAGTRRFASYNNLPPGRYTFRVTAANNDGLWNERGQSLGIRVIPPFWQVWWFRLLALISLTGLAVAAYRGRVAHLKRAHAAQEAFSRQLLESQERERKRIATELHDGLGQNLLVIKNRALLGLHLRQDQDRTVEQLDEISAAASQAIEEVRYIAANLHPYQLERLGLTKAIIAMINRVAAAAQIHFTTEIEPLDNLLDPSAAINLYRIIQESLNNIVKHAGATEAHVTIKQTEQPAPSLQITIQDNGCGFLPAVASRQTRGLGLTGMSERARMLGGTQTIHSAPGRGTTVTIKLTLPANRQAAPDAK